MADDPTEFFWQIAEQLLTREVITKGTMMGFPCLRTGGDFFASADHRNGDLIVKLSAARVGELIEEGVGQPFAPAGRTFREWVRVGERDVSLWESLLREAEDFVQGRG